MPSPPVLPIGILLLWDGEFLPPGFVDASLTYSGRLRQAIAAGAEAKDQGSAYHYHHAADVHGLAAHGGVEAVTHVHTSHTSADVNTDSFNTGVGGQYASPHMHTFATSGTAVSTFPTATTASGTVANNPVSFEYQLIKNTASTHFPPNALVLSRYGLEEGGTAFTKQSVTGGMVKITVGATGGQTGTAYHTDIGLSHDHPMLHTHGLPAAVDDLTPDSVSGVNGGSIVGPSGVSHGHPLSGTISESNAPSYFYQTIAATASNAAIYALIKFALWRCGSWQLPGERVTAFWDSTINGAVPSGWSVIGGVDGDYIFLDPDGTGNRVAASTHAATLSHWHTLDPHTHVCSLTADFVGGTQIDWFDSGADNGGTASHASCTIEPSGTAVFSTATEATTATDINPLHCKLLLIEYNTGGTELPSEVVPCSESGNFHLEFNSRVLGEFITSLSITPRLVEEVRERHNLWAEKALLDCAYPALIWDYDVGLYIISDSRVNVIFELGELTELYSAGLATLRFTKDESTTSPIAIDCGLCCLADVPGLQDPESFLLAKVGVFALRFMGTDRPTVSTVSSVNTVV